MTSAHGYSLPMDGYSERLLLDRVREGDTESFEALVRVHTPRALQLAYRLLGDRDHAEDLVQEAFLRLHRALPNFRGESAIATWLYQIITRLAIDWLRREKLRRALFFFRKDDESADPADFVPDPSLPADRQLMAVEARRQLRRSLEKLSPRQRTIFVLRHDEEMPLKEIAALLKLEEGTVKAHLHRAVTQLRRDLAHLREG